MNPLYKVLAILVFTAFIFFCGYHEAVIRYEAADDKKERVLADETEKKQAQANAKALADAETISKLKSQIDATTKKWRDERAQNKLTDYPLSPDAISILQQARSPASSHSAR